MTYREIQDEILSLRFNEQRRDPCKNWIGFRYGRIWAAAEWPFKKVEPANLTVTVGDDTPTMPVGFRRALALYNELGDLLAPVEPSAFDDAYRVDAANGVTGVPRDYKIVNQQIVLGPKPSGAYTYTLAYERGPVHFNNVGAVTAGLMSADSDYPIWDASFHYVLVFGAMSTGLRLENDPTWPAIEDEYKMALMEMANEYLPPDQVGTSQFGRDGLDSLAE